MMQKIVIYSKQIFIEVAKSIGDVATNSPIKIKPDKSPGV
jgi:hypothetical protein